METDKDKARDYAQILYAQACLSAGLELEDVNEYTKLICSLMK